MTFTKNPFKIENNLSDTGLQKVKFWYCVNGISYSEKERTLSLISRHSLNVLSRTSEDSNARDYCVEFKRSFLSRIKGQYMFFWWTNYILSLNGVSGFGQNTHKYILKESWSWTFQHGGRASILVAKKDLIQI